MVGEGAQPDDNAVRGPVWPLPVPAFPAPTGADSRNKAGEIWLIRVRSIPSPIERLAQSQWSLGDLGCPVASSEMY